MASKTFGDTIAILTVFLSFQLIAGVFVFFLSQYIKINLPVAYLPVSIAIIPLVFCLTQITPFENIIFNPKAPYYGVFLLFSALVLPLIFARVYEKRGFGAGKELSRRLPGPGKKRFLLTFDDGPHKKFTQKIVKTLKENNICAIFFLVGSHIKGNEDVVKMLTKYDMEIAVHSYSHKPLPLLSSTALDKDIGDTVRLIREITGKAPRFFRPPWGFYNLQVLETAKEHGLTTLLWSTSSRDWKEKSVNRIRENVFRSIKPGEILLFHDGCKEGVSREWTVDSLPVILSELEDMGYKSLDLKGLSMLCPSLGE